MGAFRAGLQSASWRRLQGLDGLVYKGLAGQGYRGASQTGLQGSKLGRATGGAS